MNGQNLPLKHRQLGNLQHLENTKFLGYILELNGNRRCKHALSNLHESIAPQIFKDLYSSRTVW